MKEGYIKCGNPANIPDILQLQITAWIVIARNIVLAFLACSFSLAAPGSNEELQPCGGAFYYPSKVNKPSNHICVTFADNM